MHDIDHETYPGKRHGRCYSLFTRRAWVTLCLCFVQISQIGLPYHPGQLYQLYWRVSSSVCTDPPPPPRPPLPPPLLLNQKSETKWIRVTKLGGFNKASCRVAKWTIFVGLKASAAHPYPNFPCLPLPPPDLDIFAPWISQTDQWS